MRIFGINALNHDAAISVVEDNEIVFAAHSERYSRNKFDYDLNDEIVEEALSFGNPDKIVYYERPYLKKSRQLYAGQYRNAFSLKDVPSRYLKQWFSDNIDIEYVDHHQSHAAAGYYTSPYDEAVIVVIDAIGEWDVASIWYGCGDKLEKRWSRKYPNSLGLFYSAMTQRVGLKPQEDEYILMGMDGWGERNYELMLSMRNEFFDKDGYSKLNLHRGCDWWNPKYYRDDDSDKWKFDIAANTQWILEREVSNIFAIAKGVVSETENCVYMGGVALNCVANSKLAERFYNNLWIMPNPGDAGSSLGAILATTKQHIDFKHPFLGHEIKGEYPTASVTKQLFKGNIVGLANGRAEFGPRALGNRCLLADPRGDDIKDKVNKIKKRQEFRPFAPSVLEEHAHEIFDMPVKKSQFMQFVAPCKYPEKYPAICHIDRTSRVQTVSLEDNPLYYKLIKEFYLQTGCPMVLNTSLNIKGEPIVNDKRDAMNFQKRYGIFVY